MKDSSIITIVIILVVAMLLFVFIRNSDFVFEMPVVNQPDNSFDDETIIPEEEVCSWEVIDSANVVIPGYTRSEWKTTLPAGSFRYTWDNTVKMDVEITGAFVGVDFFPQSYSDVYEMVLTSNTQRGLAISNAGLNSAGSRLELQQWLCPSDPRNFNPDVFGSPFSEQTDEQVDCNQACFDEGYTGGGWVWTEVSCYENYGDVHLGPCCCTDQLPIM